MLGTVVYWGDIKTYKKRNPFPSGLYILVGVNWYISYLMLMPEIGADKGEREELTLKE